MDFLSLMNLPQQLQQDATQFAQQQGISLEQFILWAVAEKIVATVSQQNCYRIRSNRNSGAKRISILRSPPY
jgi:hypothetical protein